MREKTISGRPSIRQNRTDIKSDTNVSSEEGSNNLSSSEDDQLSDSEARCSSPPSSPKQSKQKSLTKRTDIKLESSDVRQPESLLSKTKATFYLLILVALFVVFLGIHVRQSGVSSRSRKFCNFSELKIRYPQEDEALWDHLTARIGDLPVNPVVYLFMHLNTSGANNVISDIANVSNDCLDSSSKPVSLESNAFTSEKSIDDYGHLLRQYEDTVKEGNVVLLPILNNIPPKVARALHSICDTYSYIHPRVVIFLSLAVKEHKEDRVIDTTRRALEQLWEAELTDYELEPLITRVTQDVIFLKSN